VIMVVGLWECMTQLPTVAGDQAEAVRTREFLNNKYPTFDERAMMEMLPQSVQMEARLYEVMPCPRYPRYFRRHWW
jgi:hypothetical protein